ncbi:MAG: aminotransferase class III-fold pyridoxal phosphate-dependent enzyme [bacterium]|nr:aminotransferase class III-fold pyridoxal phosphate-dependent enzyme [bacterium]
MQKNNTIVKFSNEEAIKLAKELYGLKVTVKSLDSYSDQNFHITDEEGKGYVLKIANSNEILEILEAQNAALIRLTEKCAGAVCQEVCPTLTGELITAVKNSAGVPQYVRLLTYLPGKLMTSVPHTGEMLTDLGRFLGTMSKAFADFSHPALHRSFYWDMKLFTDLEKECINIEDSEQRNLVEHFMTLFKTFVVPQLPNLRTSVIHNDANDYNVLVTEDGSRVAGIIDFGDVIESCLIFELAISAAYAVHNKEKPLETAVHMVTGYHKEFPLMGCEPDLLYFMIAARLCTSILGSAQQLKLEPDNEYLKVSVAPSWAALERLAKIDPQHAARVFRRACNMPVEEDGPEPEKLLELRERFLGKALSISYQKPLKIVRGYMQYLYDHTGRAYLDTVNNVCHVGHCHPRVVKAAQEQMALLNTNTRYLHDNIVEYAQRLTATLPDPLSVCFFVCTGSEANELALRMAKAHTKAEDFVVIDSAYHGNTSSIIDISPYKFDGPGGKGKPEHVQKVLMPDGYRGPYRYGDMDIGKKYAADVDRALKEIHSNDRKPAAFIHESVLGVAGQVVLPDNYLKEAYASVRKAGAVCIADEVQIGFGRVGSHMWGFETQGVVPDIVTMGKPIGNGHPLAAVVTTPEIAESFNNGMEYFNTFGGNPVSCAVGLAVLDVIRDENLQENARVVGKSMKDDLYHLMDKYPMVGDVRGMGLFIGIELVKDKEFLDPAKYEAYDIAEAMKERGILISVDGPLHNVLKIKPPIVFTRENAIDYVDTLDYILETHFRHD